MEPRDTHGIRSGPACQSSPRRRRSGRPEQPVGLGGHGAVAHPASDHAIRKNPRLLVYRAGERATRRAVKTILDTTHRGLSAHVLSRGTAGGTYTLTIRATDAAMSIEVEATG